MSGAEGEAIGDIVKAISEIVGDLNNLGDAVSLPFYYTM